VPSGTRGNEPGLTVVLPHTVVQANSLRKQETGLSTSDYHRR
jgi:hypothetical protein